VEVEEELDVEELLLEDELELLLEDELLEELDEVDP
jgi:hypothetical protein